MTENKNNIGPYIIPGIFLLVGFPIVKQIMENLGLWQSKSSKDYYESISNPGSYWNPNFWRSGGAGTLLVTHSHCDWLYNEIYDSFQWYGDDEARIYAAFKTLGTQSQLSYFAYWLQQNKGTDLIKWLKGTDYGPIGDHLSTAEIKIISDYFDKLPKYKK